jgi:dynein heavy chain
VILAGGTGEDAIAGLVSDLLAKLPSNFDIEKASHKYPVRYEESLNQVLVQEMVRFNRLLDVIRSSLAAVSKALAGLAVLSTELDAVLRSLTIGSVPVAWKGKSFPSLKPLAGYMKDLSARIQMLQVKTRLKYLYLSNDLHA